MVTAEVDGFKSSQVRSLARAFNDRLRSGIGDSVYRVAYWWFNLFRQVRMPSEDGFVFPSQGEFFEIYQHLDPENGTGQWPLQSQGDPEGANPASTMMQYVLGNTADVGQEDDRIANAGFRLWLGNEPPETLGDLWNVGKMQRGVLDPLTGEQSVPALEAAQNWFQVSSDYWSPHGKSWGGYFPNPVILADDCGSTDESGQGIPSLEIKFTSLQAGVSTAGLHGTVTTAGDGIVTVTYAGSCPYWTEYGNPAVDQVQFVLRMPLAYYVGVWNGASIDIDRFQINEWIEGPYTGQGVLTRQDGGHISRALWTFDTNFRGTEEQRGDNPNIKKIAFDFQEFFTRPYLLAPARGQKDGDSIKAIYPSGSTNATLAPGAFLTVQPDGGTTHYVESGYAVCGAYATATKLAEACLVKVLIDDVAVANFTLTPDETGAAEEMVWWKQSGGSRVQIQLDNGVRLNSGTLTVELAELYEIKPDFWDAYLLLRTAATSGGDQFGAGVDGSGLDSWEAKEISNNYLQYGCIYNPGAAGVRTIDAWVTDNPIYDDMRRLSRDCMRIARRQHILSYQIVNGKSVVKMKRWAYGLYNEKADLFKGIAPSSEAMASGDLEAGREYEVTGTGAINYRGRGFAAGQSFIASAEDLTFQSSGTAKLWEKDGIIHDALSGSWTNEWVSFLQLHAYHWSESSIWKRDAYADYYTFNNRCLFFAQYGGTRRFRTHINYGYGVDVKERPDHSGYNLIRNTESVQALYISPEAPTGYTFAEHANDPPYTVPTEFYQSCQIYQKPYEVESCTSDHNGASEVVTITFKERFQSVAGADATFSADASTWDAGQLASLVAETYRTDDNAMRDYVRNQAVGDYPCPWREGDAGTYSSVTSLTDNPFGACNPHMLFVKLIPEPYVDDNETQQRSDSLCRIDDLRHAEICLRAMCEGFVDGVTSERITCETSVGSLYDYTFENLCNEAFGGRWIGAFGSTVRPDEPAGHGPLPNTVMYADVFNRLSKSVNLLTKARVMVPFDLECKYDTYNGSKVVLQDWGDPCSGSGTQRAVWTGTPPGAGTFSGSSGWLSCGSSVSVSNSGGMNGCSGAGYAVTSERTIGSFRIAVNAAHLDSLSPTLQAAIQDSGGIMCKVTTTTHWPTGAVTGSSAASDPCGVLGHYFWDGVSGWTFAERTTETVACRATGGTETFDPGPGVPGGTFFYCRDTVPNESGNTAGISIAVDFLTDAGFYVQAGLSDLTGD